MKYTGLFLDSPVFIIKKPENSLEKAGVICLLF